MSWRIHGHFHNLPSQQVFENKIDYPRVSLTMEEPLKRGGRLGSCVLMISRVRHPKKLPINVNWTCASLKNNLPIMQLFYTNYYVPANENMRCHQIDMIWLVLFCPLLRTHTDKPGRSWYCVRIRIQEEWHEEFV